MLIEHAAEQGATVYQETQIKRVLFEGDRAFGVEALMTDGSVQQFQRRSWLTPPGRLRCCRISLAGA